MIPVYRGECKFDEFVCPFGCPADSKIENLGTSSTLVGYFGGPENDGNHHYQSGQCLNCNEQFIKHYVIRDKSVWYTRGRNSHVLLGTPGCCESAYLIPCECGDWMEHSTKNKINSSSNVNGVWIPGQPMFWACLKCGNKAPDHDCGWKYSSYELINKATELAKSLPEPPPLTLKIDWVVTEVIGLGIVNKK